MLESTPDLVILALHERSNSQLVLLLLWPQVKPTAGLGPLSAGSWIKSNKSAELVCSGRCIWSPSHSDRFPSDPVLIGPVTTVWSNMGQGWDDRQRKRYRTRFKKSHVWLIEYESRFCYCISSPQMFAETHFNILFSSECRGAFLRANRSI